MIRVTRGGGRIMLFDQDYQTLAFNHPDRALTRRILQHGSDYCVANPFCGRELAPMLARSGLQEVQCWPYAHVERNTSAYLITIARRFATVAVQRGVVGADRGDRWLTDLVALDRKGECFASMTYYFACGTVRRRA